MPRKTVSVEPADINSHATNGVDTTGDGILDSIAIDIDGDGKPDIIRKDADGEQLRTIAADIGFRKNMFELAAETRDNVLSMITIVLTAAAGLLSFMSTSSQVAETQASKDLLALIVGGLATVTTVLGGMQRTFKYAAKEQAFSQASAAYRVLESKVRFKLRQSGRGVAKPDEAWWDAIQNSILDIQKDLPYYPSTQRVASWGMMGLLENANSENMEDALGAGATKLLTEVGVNSHEDLAYMSDELIESIAVNEVDRNKIRAQRIIAASKKAASQVGSKAKKRAGKALSEIHRGNGGFDGGKHTFKLNRSKISPVVGDAMGTRNTHNATGSVVLPDQTSAGRDGATAS